MGAVLLIAGWLIPNAYMSLFFYGVGAGIAYYAFSNLAKPINGLAIIVLVLNLVSGIYVFPEADKHYRQYHQLKEPTKPLR